jgi:hypothetical protein
LEEGDLKLFSINVPTSTEVNCVAKANNGDLDIYINWDGELESFYVYLKVQALQKSDPIQVLRTICLPLAL